MLLSSQQCYHNRRCKPSLAEFNSVLTAKRDVPRYRGRIASLAAISRVGNGRQALAFLHSRESRLEQRC
jgi:hypothetical protein